MAKNKRKIPATGAVGLSSKRQKLGASKPVGLSKKKRAVGIDALAWSTVDIPEMFEDAEGFYSLQAIEGVEVVKNGDNIEFVRIFPQVQSVLEETFHSDYDTACCR